VIALASPIVVALGVHGRDAVAEKEVMGWKVGGEVEQEELLQYESPLAAHGRGLAVAVPAAPAMVGTCS